MGGGSTIDTAKAIAHGTANPETDLWQFWLGKEPLTKTMPVGAVLTIPAAGSETSDSAVLTDGDAGVKRGLNTDFNRPVFAVLDPELTLTLPPYQVACGVTDILMHTLDRYFNPYVDNDTTDAIAEALLRVVLTEGDVVREHPGDLHAMSELMWAGSLSHNNLTGLGGKKDFAVHQLGHALSAKYNVTHGASPFRRVEELGVLRRSRGRLRPVCPVRPERLGRDGRRRQGGRPQGHRPPERLLPQARHAGQSPGAGRGRGGRRCLPGFGGALQLRPQPHHRHLPGFECR